ncbi:hypothetical protein FP568_09335 [Pandoraea pnomenusa]|nr:hypothetical protein FP568_09335 [Pandoraea pnomenusa]
MRDRRVMKFIVVPFREGGDSALVPVEVRAASTSFGAVRVAHQMRERHIGIAAYEVMVDPETGAMESPKVLFQHGRILPPEEAAAGW